MNLKDTIRIDLNKNTKPVYYIKAIIKLLTPRFFYKRKLPKILSGINDTNREYIEKRVAYYNKLDTPYAINARFSSSEDFISTEKKKTYFFDMVEYLKYFSCNAKIAYLFGDITEVPEIPSIVKSRPISQENQNSVLLKLDKVRHFIFLTKDIPFHDKKDLLVWRGKAHQEHRQYFLEKFYTHPLCDVGQIIKNSDKDPSAVKWVKEKLSLKKQLEYKFILAIEGNDVASNLKWVMSSNSLAFMTKPKYETWFMEGTLIPNFHYVLLKDDYSDLEEKINYYATHIQEALSIIKNAHEYIEQFKDKQREDIISILVLDKYFRLQNNA